MRCAFLALMLTAAALLPAAFASGRIDTAHAARDRKRADACVLGGVVIYTDPYIGRRMSHAAIVADIARMCAGPFARYADDRMFGAAETRWRLRHVIEAGLRGQFRESGGTEARRDAR
jgi:hypothetical protein